MKAHYDYIIIGSGFGGSVSALRLAEKGYSVLVIEKGKWYQGKDFPKTNWNLKRWMWLPALRLFGILKLTFLRHISILSGVGVGGGSLVYANTLPKPKSQFFNHGSWSGLADWEKELNPFYETAWEMLGATENKIIGDAEEAMKKLAVEIGKEDKYRSTKVAVYFGEKGREVKDPYFDGKGPTRTGCVACGACMTGCRHNAKNTLDKNYLHLAQQSGVDILAENEVQNIILIGEEDGSEGYLVSFKKSTKIFSSTKSISGDGVIFSGGVLGTIPLLLKLKSSSLPKLSNKVGDDVRSNNESLILNISLDKKKDFSKGIAIGSIIELDENSHLESVKYGAGSGFWRILMMPKVSEKSFFLRIIKLIFKPLSDPIGWMKVLFVRDFAKQSTVLLFMQHLDSKLRFKKGRFGMKSSVSSGVKPTAFIPEADEMAKRHAKITNSKSVAIFTETLTGIPSTAHILGGAVMGENSDEGVIDKDNKVFGYKNMYVCDGSMISANPGVNPSLSITAISERAMSKIVSKNQL
ncbi:MAG: GMC family oxidoreductase [Cytophagales bacterium]|nr:GMC family oxidoreductase [Cytophagales bacterium]